MKKTDTLILVFAVIGLIISAYLTYSYMSGGHTTFCLSGSGCDVVKDSPYSKVFGISVPHLGLIGYLIIIAAVHYRSLGSLRYSIIYYFSLAGVAFSLYLTYLEIAVIHAVCSYCVLSAIFVLAIFIAVLFSRQFKDNESLNGKFIISSLAVFLAVIGVSYAAHSGARSSAPASQAVTNLAKYMGSADCAMYGSYTCPHCNTQKLMFGDAFKYIKYVECNPNGKNANVELCNQKGIEAFPTWDINGQFYEGAKSLRELAKLTGYKPPEDSANK